MSHRPARAASNHSLSYLRTSTPAVGADRRSEGEAQPDKNATETKAATTPAQAETRFFIGHLPGVHSQEACAVQFVEQRRPSTRPMPRCRRYWVWPFRLIVRQLRRHRLHA